MEVVAVLLILLGIVVGFVYLIYKLINFLFFRNSKNTVKKKKPMVVPKKEAVKPQELTQQEKINEQIKGLNTPFELKPDADPYFMVFDVETTGFLPEGVPEKDFKEYPFPIQIAWMVFDYDGYLINEANYIMRQDCEIPADVVKIHGITTDRMRAEGIPPREVYDHFVSDLAKVKLLIAHNINYDYKVVKADFYRHGIKVGGLRKKRFCTMKRFTKFADIMFSSGKLKWPNLSELAAVFFVREVDPSKFKLSGAHRAEKDVFYTAKCFFDALHVWEIISFDKDE